MRLVHVIYASVYVLKYLVQMLALGVASKEKGRCYYYCSLPPLLCRWRLTILLRLVPCGIMSHAALLV